MGFLNPFKKYDVEDFPDVYIPLAQATRHPSVVAENKRRSSVATANSDHTAVNKEANIEKTKETGSDDETFTLEQLRAEIDADIASSGHDSAYDRKAKVINKAIQDIGMGSYQWQLFTLCGFGWLADNLWLQGVALTLNSLSQEFGVGESEVRYTTLSLFCGLCVGACFWGTISDIVGRRPAFNLTLFICAVFGTSVGASSTWIQACALYAAMVR